MISWAISTTIPKNARLKISTAIPKNSILPLESALRKPYAGNNSDGNPNAAEPINSPISCLLKPSGGWNSRWLIETIFPICSWIRNPSSANKNANGGSQERYRRDLLLCAIHTNRMKHHRNFKHWQDSGRDQSFPKLNGRPRNPCRGAMCRRK